MSKKENSDIRVLKQRMLLDSVERGDHTDLSHNYSPRTAEFVARLVPVLDSFDYDAEAVADLVRRCDHDEYALQTAVAMILDGRGDGTDWAVKKSWQTIREEKRREAEQAEQVRRAMAESERETTREKKRRDQEFRTWKPWEQDDSGHARHGTHDDGQNGSHWFNAQDAAWDGATWKDWGTERQSLQDDSQETWDSSSWNDRSTERQSLQDDSQEATWDGSSWNDRSTERQSLQDDSQEATWDGWIDWSNGAGNERPNAKDRSSWEGWWEPEKAENWWEHGSRDTGSKSWWSSQPEASKSWTSSSDKWSDMKDERYDQQGQRSLFNHGDDYEEEESKAPRELSKAHQKELSKLLRVFSQEPETEMVLPSTVSRMEKRFLHFQAKKCGLRLEMLNSQSGSRTLKLVKDSFLHSANSHHQNNSSSERYNHPVKEYPVKEPRSSDATLYSSPPAGAESGAQGLLARFSKNVTDDLPVALPRSYLLAVRPPPGLGGPTGLFSKSQSDDAGVQSHGGDSAKESESDDEVFGMQFMYQGDDVAGVEQNDSLGPGADSHPVSSLNEEPIEDWSTLVYSDSHPVSALNEEPVGDWSTVVYSGSDGCTGGSERPSKSTEDARSDGLPSWIGHLSSRAPPKLPPKPSEEAPRVPSRPEEVQNKTLLGISPAPSEEGFAVLPSTGLEKDCGYGKHPPLPPKPLMDAPEIPNCQTNTDVSSKDEYVSNPNGEGSPDTQENVFCKNQIEGESEEPGMQEERQSEDDEEGSDEEKQQTPSTGKTVQAAKKKKKEKKKKKAKEENYETPAISIPTISPDVLKAQLKEQVKAELRAEEERKAELRLKLRAKIKDKEVGSSDIDVKHPRLGKILRDIDTPEGRDVGNEGAVQARPLAGSRVPERSGVESIPIENVPGMGGKGEKKLNDPIAAALGLL